MNTMSLLQAAGLGVTVLGLVLVVLAVAFAASAIKIVKEYERGVIFRLGRVRGGPKGPGLFLLIPFVDRMEKVDLRTVPIDLLRPFMGPAEGADGAKHATRRQEEEVGQLYEEAVEDSPGPQGQRSGEGNIDNGRT